MRLPHPSRPPPVLWRGVRCLSEEVAEPWWLPVVAGDPLPPPWRRRSTSGGGGAAAAVAGGGADASPYWKVLGEAGSARFRTPDPRRDPGSDS